MVARTARYPSGWGSNLRVFILRVIFQTQVYWWLISRGEISSKSNTCTEHRLNSKTGNLIQRAHVPTISGNDIIQTKNPIPIIQKRHPMHHGHYTISGGPPQPLHMMQDSGFSMLQASAASA